MEQIEKDKRYLDKEIKLLNKFKLIRQSNKYI